MIRIRNGEDTEAWKEFHEIYAPIIYGYAMVRGLQHDDALDVQADCYETIVRQIGQFEYEKQKGGFKAWLRTIVNRRVVDFLRKRKEVNADTYEVNNLSSENDPTQGIWDEQWKNQLLSRCFQLAKDQVSEIQFEAFRLLVEDEKSVIEVENMTGLNSNQIYKAKARVLKVIRSIYNSMDEDLK